MKTRASLTIIILSALLGCDLETYREPEFTQPKYQESPNIVLIYLDDLGIGDVSGYWPGQLKTPAIDRLAEEGIRFTQGYASSAMCSPSRLSLLTGNYPWRAGAARILMGDDPLMISPEAQSLPKLMQSAGYSTAIIGKWHLGLGSGKINWNSRIEPGPKDVGFDYSFIMAATNDRVPQVYIENGIVQGLEPGDPLLVSYDEPFEGELLARDNPELMTKMRYSTGYRQNIDQSVNNGIPRGGYQKGGKAANWIDEEMSETFLHKVLNFIEAKRSKPFFIVYAMHQPHVPRVPSDEFSGRSTLGARGDVILEADAAIGELHEYLQKMGLLENTMIIVSSDNGPSLNDGYDDGSPELNGSHSATGPHRGGKYSLLDGGTRVPFITYWKGKITPAVSEALVTQIDFLPSLASLVGEPAVVTDGEDLIDTLLGTDNTSRGPVVLTGKYGRYLRTKDWVFIPPTPGPKVRMPENIETGTCDCTQLYRIGEDPAQLSNLAEKYPEKTEELSRLFKKIISDD